MALGGQIRTRSERVAALELPPGQWERAWIGLRRADVLIRIGIALLAAVAMCLVMEGWNPPFGFRSGATPQRAIVVRAPFSVKDGDATRRAQDRAGSQVRYVYEQDPGSLIQLRTLLRNKVIEITTATKLGDLDPKLWRDFQVKKPDLNEALVEPDEKEKKKPDGEKSERDLAEERFQEFRAMFSGTEKQKRLEDALAAAFLPFELRGLIDKLPQGVGEGNLDEILVHPVGQPEPLRQVKVAEVLIGDGAALRDAMRKELGSKEIADAFFEWLRPQLKSTLKKDEEETQKAILTAENSVEPVMTPYPVGKVIAEGGKPITPQQMELLRKEYQAAIEARMSERSYLLFARGGAVTALAFASFVLCGVYMRYRQRGPLTGLGRLCVLLLVSIATVALARWASADDWRAESVPLLIFGMTMAIAYRREMSLLMTGILTALVVLALGHDFREFVLLMGLTAAAILNLGCIRTRSKLIYVGISSAVAAFALTVALGMVSDQPLGWTLLRSAGVRALWSVAAGFVMTGLLPFIEQAFGVLTDLSLLELGDVSHPLLQELVRRAPSTYNHSVTVGTIAEAAADSIGARGLLCRVGAYFHDIGKMLKPGYFVENQGVGGDNRHESLVPAMSTLVIIAHIKDGYDLARQHHLPQPIIDFISQHHGTMLVEYFYSRAQKQSDPNNGEVDESSFRYPGPKPQTKEAAVMMLADAVESASRTLVDPAPARIESLVREIAERRLDDGQFDESGLTLRELRTIERSMVMSITSIYHGRIKYPDQKTA